jgi:hypothetical protein
VGAAWDNAASDVRQTAPDIDGPEVVSREHMQQKRDEVLKLIRSWASRSRPG